MKKILTCAIALILCLAMLTGCGPKDKPVSTPTSTDTSNGSAAPTVAGELFDAGNVTALVPEGWMAFPESDLFSDDPDAVDPDVITICKDAESDFDLFSNPYVRIDYYGPDRDLWEPSKEWYDDAKDLDPTVIGPYTWNGFQGTSFGTPTIILWTVDGENEYQISIICEASNGKISLEDADVQAIIASVMPSDGSAGAATNTPAATEPATEPTETTEPTPEPMEDIVSTIEVPSYWYGWVSVDGEDSLFADVWGIVDTISDGTAYFEAYLENNDSPFFSMYAQIGAYQPDGYEWVDELCQVLSQNVDYACRYIEQHFDGIRVSHPQGTYMIYLDCAEWCRTNGKTIDDLLKTGYEVGVDWQDGRPFFLADSIRMNLALPFSRVQEAFERLHKYVFA